MCQAGGFCRLWLDYFGFSLILKGFNIRQEIGVKLYPLQQNICCTNDDLDVDIVVRLAARAEEKSSPSCIDFPVSGPILKKVNFLLGKFEFYAKVNFDVFYNSNKFIIYQYLRRCGGLVVRVHTSRLPGPGSNLGPGPPHSVVWGAADHTVILYK